MKIASLADVKAQFSAFVKESAGGPVVVTRNGKPVAVLVGVNEDAEVEDLLLAHSPRLRALLDASRRELAEGKGIPHDEFWQQVKPRKGKPSRKR
jgi:prevent-host-death family protein